jgi:propanediol dehydratase small subunit
MDENLNLEEIIREVINSMMGSDAPKQYESKDACGSNCEVKLNVSDYPLAKNSKELIKTRTGKGLDDITLESVLNGETSSDDIKITGEILLYQAQIADSAGRYQFAFNLRRAAELTVVPDQRVLEIYNALRPYRSTKEQLLDIASELENKYNAKINAKLVREACEVYEKRGRQ